MPVPAAPLADANAIALSSSSGWRSGATALGLHPGMIYLGLSGKKWPVCGERPMANNGRGTYEVAAISYLHTLHRPFGKATPSKIIFVRPQPKAGAIPTPPQRIAAVVCCVCAILLFYSRRSFDPLFTVCNRDYSTPFG